jgi:hypothetical protein
MTTTDERARVGSVMLEAVEAAEQRNGHDLTAPEEGDPVQERWTCLSCPAELVMPRGAWAATGSALRDLCVDPDARQRRHDSRVGRITVEGYQP